MPLLKKPTVLKYLINLWPPFWGTGIHVEYIANDFQEVIVGMKLRFYNKNYVGTHFGGSLFSMTDPFYMLMLFHTLGNEYIVWDKAADIEFIAPGKDHVKAHFILTDSTMAEIKKQTTNGDKFFITLPVEIKDKSDNLIAKLKRTIYIRKKNQYR